MSNIDMVLEQFATLDKEELKKIAEKIHQLLSKADRVSAPIDKCRKCETDSIVKFGKDKNGKQRYRCRNCGATFSETSYSVVANSHCSEGVWVKYIELLLEGASLAKCAAKCGISCRTAFVWRHKILNAMQKDQTDRLLSGIVEADEMFVSVSYKGNHKKSKRFQMPRKAFARGTDNTNPKTPKACVMCVLERNGQSYAEFVGLGVPHAASLSRVFKKRILPESIVIADSARATKRCFDDITDIELVQMQPLRNNKKPEIRGAYHIQGVNNLHHRFRVFLRKYNGVATKYLMHYFGLFMWIENRRKINDINLNEALSSYIGQKDTYVPAEKLFCLPPLPSAA